MSRDLNGSSQYLSRADALGLTAYPVTVAGWMWLDALPSSGNFDTSFALADDPTADNSLYISVDSGGTMWAGAGALAGWGVGAASSNAVGTGAWHHVAAVWTSATSRRIVVDGNWASSGTDTSNAGGVFPANLDILELGRWVNNTEYTDGQLAHWAVWSAALSQTDVEGLYNGGTAGAGKNPLAVQNASLVAYWPLAGTASPEPDDKNNYDLTLNGSPAQGGSNPNVDAPPGAAVGPAFRRSHIMQLIMAGH